jgi:hypothetical protein
MEGNRPTPGLLVVGGVGAGPDSSIDGWGAISEGAGHEVRVGATRMPAHIERLKVVQGQRCPAIWEDVGWAMLGGEDEGQLWREMFVFNARICIGAGVAIFVGVIFGAV